MAGGSSSRHTGAYVQVSVTGAVPILRLQRVCAHCLPRFSFEGDKREREPADRRESARFPYSVLTSCCTCKSAWSFSSRRHQRHAPPPKRAFCHSMLCWRRSDKPTVFACSALKRKYREVLAARAASGSPAHILFVSPAARGGGGVARDRWVTRFAGQPACGLSLCKMQLATDAPTWLSARCPYLRAFQWRPSASEV